MNYAINMVVSCGSLCFGLVLGWLTIDLAHRSRAGWGALKVALTTLSGAALQQLFGASTGLLLYGIGLIIGAALYGITLLVAPLRYAHNFQSIEEET